MLAKRALASADRRSEDVCIFSIVELKFRDVQRQILSADLIEASNDSAFDNGPKSIVFVWIAPMTPC